VEGLGSPVCAPHMVSATGVQAKVPSLPEAVPSDWPGVQAPGRLCRGPQRNVHSAGCGWAWRQGTLSMSVSYTLVPDSCGQGRKKRCVRSFDSFCSCWAGPEATGKPQAGGGRTCGGGASTTGRPNQASRQTDEGTMLSLQPHGGNTANTILNNPVGQAEGRGQGQPRGSLTHTSHAGGGWGLHLISSRAPGARKLEI
jgi:hypothetical protein